MKSALIGLGSSGGKIVDNFDIAIDKIVVDSDTEVLSSLKNSRTIKIDISIEDEQINLSNDDIDKIVCEIKKI